MENLNSPIENKLEKKIKDLKKFIEQKTDLGTSNYLGQEIREICGLVEAIIFDNRKHQ